MSQNDQFPVAPSVSALPVSALGALKLTLILLNKNAKHTAPIRIWHLHTKNIDRRKCQKLH